MLSPITNSAPGNFQGLQGLQVANYSSNTMPYQHGDELFLCIDLKAIGITLSINAMSKKIIANSISRIVSLACLCLDSLWLI